MLMYTVVNPTRNQCLKAPAQTIEDTFNGLNERMANSIKIVHTYRFELTLAAIAAFFVLFSIYILFYAPPVPPCVDGYQQS